MNRTARLSSRQLIAFDGLAAIAYLTLFAPTAIVGSDLPAAVAVPLMLVIGAPLAARRRWRSSVRSLVSQTRTIFRICSFEIIFPPSVKTFAPLCSRLFLAEASS